MSINDGGQAFPTIERIENNGQVVQFMMSPGMNQRDFITAICAAAITSAKTWYAQPWYVRWLHPSRPRQLVMVSPASAVACARNIADAMLAEREKGAGQ